MLRNYRKMGDDSTDFSNIKRHIGFWARVASLLGLDPREVLAFPELFGHAGRREQPRVKTGGALAHQKWKRRRAAGWAKTN